MNIVKTRSELLLGKTIFDMNLNVGYYARVSTDKDDQLNSLENQSKYSAFAALFYKVKSNLQEMQ